VLRDAKMIHQFEIKEKMTDNRPCFGNHIATVNNNKIENQSFGLLSDTSSLDNKNNCEPSTDQQKNPAPQNSTIPFDSPQINQILQNNTNDIILIITLDVSPIIKFVNTAFIKSMGFNAQYITGHTFFDFIHQDDKQQIKTILMKYYDLKINNMNTTDVFKNTQKIVFRFQDNSGSWHNFKSIIAACDDELLLLIKDITIEKNLEDTLHKSEELLFKTIQLSHQMITITSLEDGRYIDVNDSFLQQTGFTRDEVINHTATELNIWINPSDREKFIDTMKEQKIVRNMEFPMKNKAGKIGHVLMSSEIITFQGQSCALTITTNITDKKHHEDIIQSNEQKMNTIIQSLPIASFVLDSKHRILYWNRALEELTKLKSSEMIGTTNPWKAFYPSKRPCLADLLIDGKSHDIEKWYAGKYKKVWDNEDSFDIIDFFPNLGTEGKWLQLFATSIKDNKENVIGVLETINDVSEQKKIEIALSENEKKYRMIFDYAGDGMVLLDMTGCIVDVNEKTIQIFGGSKDEIIGRHFKDLHILSIRDLPKLLKNFGMIIAGKSNAFDVVIKNKNGQIKYLESSSSVITQNKKKIGILAVIRDVTDNKKVEMALRDNEERFRLAISSMTDILYEWDVNTGSLQWFGDIDRRMGYEKGEFPRTLEGFLNHVHPQDLTKVKTIAKNGLKTHQKWQGEYRIINKNNEEFYWNGTGIGIYDKSGAPMRVLGSITDITKRKQAEQSLEESQKMLRLIMDTIPARVFWKNRDSKYLGCNRGFAQDAGFKSESEIIGKTDYDLSWIEQADLYRADDKLVIQSGQPKLQYVEPQTTPDGRKIWLRTNKIPLMDGKDNIIGVLGTYEDITEQKEAEVALRRSEEQYRIVTENASDVIWTMDLNLHFTYISPSNEKLTGYRKEAALELTLEKLLTPESVEQAMKIFAKELEIESSEQKDLSRNVILELNEVKADGTIFPVETRMSFLRDGSNNPIGIIGITRDITERKRAETALKKSEEKFVKAFNLSPVAIAINRFKDWKFININEAFIKLCGYDGTELLSHTPLELHLYMNDDLGQQIIQTINTEGSIYNQEFAFRTKSGDPIIARYSAEIIDFGGERCCLSVIVDVTEQKNLEDSLKENEEKYRSILENTQDVIMLTNPDGRVEYISPACLKVLGYEPVELVGKIPEIFHQDDVEKVHAALSTALEGKPGTNMIYRVLTKNGVVQWVSHSWTPILTKEKKLKFVVSVVRNITDSKQFEQNLQLKIAELERYKNVTVNREVKMIDLKKEIKTLKGKIANLENDIDHEQRGG
jgi:PAS domain S-box-containing protein